MECGLFLTDFSPFSVFSRFVLRLAHVSTSFFFITGNTQFGDTPGLIYSVIH